MKLNANSIIDFAYIHTVKDALNDKIFTLLFKQFLSGEGHIPHTSKPLSFALDLGTFHYRLSCTHLFKASFEIPVQVHVD